MALTIDVSKVKIIVDGYSSRYPVDFEAEPKDKSTELSDSDLYGNSVAIVQPITAYKIKITTHKDGPDYLFLKRVASANKKVDISFVDDSCSYHKESVYFKDCYISVPKLKTGKDGAKVEFEAVGTLVSDDLKEK